MGVPPGLEAQEVDGNLGRQVLCSVGGGVEPSLLSRFFCTELLLTPGLALLPGRIRSGWGLWGVTKSVRDTFLMVHAEGGRGRVTSLFLFPYILFMGLLWTPGKASE